jgi:predicted chitinase
VDLINSADRAMEPDIAAAILAEYFVRAKVVDAAQRSDWSEVRRRVQGGTDGLDELLRVVRELGFAGDGR